MTFMTPNSIPPPRGLATALYAASLGWHVFPITERNSPFSREVIAAALGIDPAAPNGPYVATTDSAKIVALWSGDRIDARIGIGMGNGLMAIDCDEKKDKSGSKTMGDNRWAVPQTAHQKTRNGGYHFIVRLPSNTRAPNDTGDSGLGIGLDRRGDGGYIALYDMAMLTMAIADAPQWSLSKSSNEQHARIPPGHGKCAPSKAIANDALLSRDPDDMGYHKWLLFSGSYFAATYGLMSPEEARATWLTWNLSYPNNDPAGNARTWADFQRNGTNGDFETLAKMSDHNKSTAFAHHLFDGIEFPKPPCISAAPPPTIANRDFFIRAHDMQYRPPEHLIHQLVETDSLAVVFGDPAAGKSFVAIDMACAVVTGTGFHGLPTKQGPVFYIAGEGHNGIKRRLNAWETLNCKPLGHSPIFFSRIAAQLLDDDSATMVANEIEAHIALNGVPKLIVIDTLARNFGVGDENNQKDMTAFISVMDRLRGRFPGCTIIIVHHSGHGDKDRARGSSVLKGAVDTEFKVSRTDDRITLENHKMKDGPTPQPMQFHLVSVAESAALTYIGKPDKSSINGLSSNERLVLNAFKECGGAIISRKQWQERFWQKRPESTNGANKRAFDRAIIRLIGLNIITTNDDGESYCLTSN